MYRHIYFVIVYNKDRDIPTFSRRYKLIMLLYYQKRAYLYKVI